VHSERRSYGAKRSRDTADSSSRVDTSTDDDSDDESRYSSPLKKNRTAAGGGASSQGNYLNTLYYVDMILFVVCVAVLR
jgi:hypothetical protein